MSLPRTDLSFLYHGMIPPYQDEMHADFDAAFARFNVTDSVFQQASVLADAAAFELRNSPASTHAQTALEAASLVIFDRLASVLAQEVAQGVSDRGQPADGSGLTQGAVAAVYRLLYSKAFQDTDPAAPDPSVQTAWAAFKSALSAGSGDALALASHAASLCNLMKLEANGGIWTFWW